MTHSFPFFKRRLVLILFGVVAVLAGAVVLLSKPKNFLSDAIRGTQESQGTDTQFSMAVAHKTDLVNVTQEELARIAIEAAVPDVRKAAIERLSDLDLLKKVIHNAEDNHIRDIASKKVVSSLIPPSTFQGLTDNPTTLATTALPQATQKKIQAALDLANSNPVQAYLTFRNWCPSAASLAAEIKNPEHQTWVLGTKAALEKHALAWLSHDEEVARLRGDLRGEWIAQLIKPRFRDETPATPAARARDFYPLKAMLLASFPSGVVPDHLSWARHAAQTWDITGIKTEFHTSYSEQGMLKSLTINPHADCRIMRVMAQVRNTASDDDPPYVTEALGSSQRIGIAIGGFGINKENEKLTKSGPRGRWAAAEHFLIIGRQGVYPCEHVCQGATGIRYEGSSHSLSGNPLLDITTKPGPTVSNVLYMPGSFIAAGDQFTLDVLFSIPISETDLRLLVLGNNPIPLQQ